LSLHLNRQFYIYCVTVIGILGLILIRFNTNLVKKMKRIPRPKYQQFAQIIRLYQKKIFLQQRLSTCNGASLLATAPLYLQRHLSTVFIIEIVFNLIYWLYMSCTRGVDNSVTVLHTGYYSNPFRWKSIRYASQKHLQNRV